MSIASEITSIGENLKKDYQAIANLGVDLTNVDKNIENIAELLDGVYDNLPKTEYQTGTEINLGKTIKGKLDFDNGVVGIGQSEQESTNGYQLWGGTNYTNGTTFKTNDDGSIYVNLNNQTGVSANTTNAIQNNLVKTLQAGTYTFSVTGLIVGLKCDIVVVSGTTGTVLKTLDLNTLYSTITISETTNYFIRVSTSQAVTKDGLIYPMLESGSTAHDWEKFTGRNSLTFSFLSTRDRSSNW